MRTLKRSECVVMPLVLTHKWYDMIDKGDKREEYRLDTPYWRKRIDNWLANDAPYKVVSFSRGYRQAGMYWLADVCRRTPQCPGYTHTAWGEDDYLFAPEGYWVLKLLKRVGLED